MNKFAADARALLRPQRNSQPAEENPASVNEALAAWQKDPGPHTTGPVLLAATPIIESALRSYTAGQSSPTLVSRAKEIVIDSLPNYDASKGSFKTYMLSHLQGLRRYQQEESSPLRIPDRVRLAAHHVHTATQELRDRLGRDPSDAELSAHTGLPLPRIAQTRQIKQISAESMMSQISNSDGEQSTMMPAVRTTQVPKETTWFRFVYRDLEPRDQLIMEHVFGLHGKEVLSKRQIAAKLGITPAAVTQRAARIDEALKLNGEPGFNML